MLTFLPSDLQSYSSIISVVLLFADGLIIGLAIKKAMVSALLVIVGVIFAGFIGLNIPFISAGDIETHLLNIFMSQYKHLGAIVYGFPMFWLIGLAIGIWKG